MKIQIKTGRMHYPRACRSCNSPKGARLLIFPAAANNNIFYNKNLKEIVEQGLIRNHQNHHEPKMGSYGPKNKTISLK